MDVDRQAEEMAREPLTGTALELARQASEYDSTGGPAFPGDEPPGSFWRRWTGAPVMSWLLAIGCLTVPPALVNGHILRRWGVGHELQTHAATLEKIPTEVGAWRYVAPGQPIHATVIKQLELQGYLHRVYEHSQTHQQIQLLLLVGPAGPLVRHPPEICYGNQANELLESGMLTVKSEGRLAHFQLLAFRSEAAVVDDFLVAYAFGSHGVWDKPESPRLKYGGEPMLYKLQALTSSSAEFDRKKPDGMADFLASLIPVLNERFESQRAK